MITNKAELKRVMSIDKKTLGIPDSKKRPSLLGDNLWKYLILLRRHEYYHNRHDTAFRKIMYFIYRGLHRYYGIFLGFTIPVNTFGAGLKLNHYGTIVVNRHARIGRFCDIHVDVNIGQGMTEKDVPVIGDNVWIGPGAKIYGDITIADGIMIGANSVVNKSFTEPDITIAGVPAKKIKGTGNPFKRHIEDY